MPYDISRPRDFKSGAQQVLPSIPTFMMRTVIAQVSEVVVQHIAIPVRQPVALYNVRHDRTSRGCDTTRRDPAQQR